MPRTRSAISLTITTVALLAATTIGGGAMAQSPAAPSPTPTVSDPACAGMRGPASSMDPGMMGGPNPTMDHGMTGSSPAPVAPASPAMDAPGVPGAVRITVTLTDAFRMEPCSMTVQAGVPITFVVTNAGAIDHEFFLGDAAEQDAHDREMIAMGGVAMHDEDHGMTVPPGATKELTWTFEAPGQVLAGCHVPGHYPAGMKATIDVVP